MRTLLGVPRYNYVTTSANASNSVVTNIGLWLITACIYLGSGVEWPHHAVLLFADAIITTDVIIEFKDRVIGLMMTDDFGSLKAVASGKKVELCPLPAPRLGFRVKGEPKEVEAVKKYCNQLRITVERNSVGYEQMVLSASSQPVCATIEVDQYRKGLEKDLKVVTKCSLEGHVFHQAGLRVTSDHVTFIRIVVGDLLAEQADAIVIPTGRAVDSCPIELPSLAMCGNSRSLESSLKDSWRWGGQNVWMVASYRVHMLFGQVSLKPLMSPAISLF